MAQRDESRKMDDCLVVMPFGSDARAAFNWQTIYESVIEPLIREALGESGGVEGWRIIDCFVSGILSQEIEQRLRTARLVVADLTDDNPNVYLELGFRRAVGKPVVCIRQETGAKPLPWWGGRFQVRSYVDEQDKKKIVEDIRAALSEELAPAGSRQALAELHAAVDARPKNTTALQERLASWRIDIARDQVEAIYGRSWTCDVREPETYLGHLIEGMADHLQPGDRYLTVSNMPFWKDIIDGRLLDENTERSKLGVTFKRVILLDTQQLQVGTLEDLTEVERVLAAHQEAIDDVIQATGKRWYDAKCLLSGDFDADRKKYKHFALLEAEPNTNCVVLLPDEPSARQTSQLVVRIPNRSRDIRRWRARFDGAFNDRRSRSIKHALDRVRRRIQAVRAETG